MSGRDGPTARHADRRAALHAGLHQLPTHRDHPLPRELRPEGASAATGQPPLLGRHGEARTPRARPGWAATPPMWVGSHARLMPCSGLSPQVKQLLAEGINRPRKGHDAGDHPPITPMKSATEAELGMGAPPRKFAHVQTCTHARARALQASQEGRVRSFGYMAPLDGVRPHQQCGPHRPRLQ